MANLEDENKTNEGASAVHKQQEDSEDVLNPGDFSPVLNTVLKPINNKFEHEHHHMVVRLLFGNLICRLHPDAVPSNKY
jgi:hypothetical protein